MAGKRNPKSKDSADKHTLNPPAKGGPKNRPSGGGSEGSGLPPGQAGQYTGEGTPSLQKK